jgi:hypothetical protein
MVAVEINLTFHPIYQTDTTGPFRPNAATALSLGRGFDPHGPYFTLRQFEIS